MWRLVTDAPENWSQEEASVVCRSLGFTRGAETATQGRTFGLIPGRTAGVRGVECEGHEDHLLQCRLRLGTQEDVERTVVGKYSDNTSFQIKDLNVKSCSYLLFRTLQSCSKVRFIL